MGEIWGFVTEGFFVDSADIANHASQSYLSPNSYAKWRPGDLKFKDLNGDGKIDVGLSTDDNPGDRTIIGNTTPRYTFGVNLNGSWRGISLSSFFQGVGKQNWHPSSEADYFWGQYNRPYNNIPAWHLNPGVIWTPENPSQDAFFPRYTGYAAQGGARQLGVNQTKYVMNIAYVRLKNLQVGYDLPAKTLSRIGARGATVYATAENLWTYSPLYKFVKNVDVENISAGSDRILTNGTNGDGLNYPMMKSLTLGVSLNF